MIVKITFHVLSFLRLSTPLLTLALTPTNSGVQERHRNLPRCSRIIRRQRTNTKEQNLNSPKHAKHLLNFYNPYHHKQTHTHNENIPANETNQPTGRLANAKARKRQLSTRVLSPICSAPARHASGSFRAQSHCRLLLRAGKRALSIHPHFILGTHPPATDASPAFFQVSNSRRLRVYVFFATSSSSFFLPVLLFFFPAEHPSKPTN